MEMNENYPCLAHGRINTFWTKGDDIQAVPIMGRRNVITYSGADVIAQVLAGNTEYIPQHIGFLYSANATPGLDDPADLTGNIKRAHDWTKIQTDAASATANVLISPLVMNASVGLAGDSAYYAHNATTFAAHTGVSVEYGFPLGGSFAPAFTTGDYIHHVLLLNRRVVNGSPVYIPVARAALAAEGSYPQKPADSEYAVFWTIEFN